LEKGLIKVMGRKDIPGRPIVYGTTQAFLELFSLNTLSDLPTLREIVPPSVSEEISQERVQGIEAEAATPQETSTMKAVEE